MADNVSVRVTAEVVDLQAKFAIAKAESQALTRELNTLAKQAATGAGGAELKVSLTQAAEAAVRAKGQMNALGGQLQNMGGHISVVRELGMAIREMAEGRIDRLPVTLARLGHEIGGLGLAATAGIAGLVATAAAIAAVALNAEKARAAVAQLQFKGDFAGGNRTRQGSDSGPHQSARGAAAGFPR